MSNFRVLLELTEGFTLDTDRLDTGVLGYLSEEITSPIYSVNVKRGKNRELDKFSPGTCQIEFDNRDRAFEPTFTGSPLYGSIYPGRRIQVISLAEDSSGNEVATTIFTGFTVDWSYSYTIGGEARATVSCADGLTKLAGINVTSITAPAELTGQRIMRVLTSPEVNYPSGDLVIDNGNTVVAATTVTGAIIDQLNQVNLTEQGMLFIGAQGNVRFIERNSGIYIYQWVADNFSDFADFEYSDIQVEYSNDTLVNFVNVTAPAGTAVAQNLLSVENYQSQAQEYATLHTDSNELENFAKYIVSEYGTPEYRIASVTFNVDKILQAADPNRPPYLLTSTDIGSLVGVQFKPPGAVGEIDNIDQYPGLVIGVEHKATPSRYDITVSLMKFVGYNAFRLDDFSRGVLNQNSLAF